MGDKQQDTLVSVVIPTRNRAAVLRDCLASVFASTYRAIEVTVVDNGSCDSTVEMVGREYPSATVVSLGKNLFLAGARNAGLRRARGAYVLFVDDDNVVAPRMIEELVTCMESDSRIGLIGPKTYYYGTDRIICWAGATISLLTSVTRYRGSAENETGRYDEMADTEQIPNVVMVRREVFDKTGEYDELYRMSYADADQPRRAIKAGYKVVYCPRAITYHRIPVPGSEAGKKAGAVRGIHMRAYYFARNRVIFMRRFAPRWNFVVFLLVFYPLLTAHYALLLARERSWPGLHMHVRGTLDGLVYAFTGKVRDYFSVGGESRQEALLEQPAEAGVKQTRGQ